MEYNHKKISNWTQQVLLLVKLSRYESADKLLNTFLQEHQAAALYNLKGVILQRQSLFPQAIDEFKKALKIDPAHVESALNLVATYADVGMYQEARSLYRSITDPKKNHSSKKIYESLAKHHLEQSIRYQDFGLSSQAIEEAKKGLKIDPTDLELNMLISKLYFSDRQFHKAKAQLEQGLKAHPKNEQLIIWLGLALRKLGKKQRAEIEWGKIQPEASNAHAAALLKEISHSQLAPTHSDQPL